MLDDKRETKQQLKTKSEVNEKSVQEKNNKPITHKCKKFYEIY